MKYPVYKRVLDIIGSMAALIVFTPVMAVIALVIWFTEGRPIFYRQPRMGLHGKMFKIIKFRSMAQNSDETLKKNQQIYNQYISNDYKLPEGEDPRITRIGKFLRKTSLDELPQFWNVLKGEMSLVGPRPIVPVELKEYGPRKNLFLQMKPGITGIWQISGRSELKYPERTDVELKYIKKQSLGYDMKVLYKTVHGVVKRKGAF